jgi:hypothetical protein
MGEGSIMSHIKEIRYFSGSSENAPNLSERHGHLWALVEIHGLGLKNVTYIFFSWAII